MSNEKISDVGINIQEKATVIWNIANALFGYFKPHEYGLVILPMTVVKRFHDCLLPTHASVQEQYEKVKKLAVIDGFLTRASGYQFYNTSKFTFDLLLADPDNIEANFRDYLAGFSSNVQDVLAKFDFDTIIKRMVDCNSLYLVIKEFASPKGYLGPDKISDGQQLFLLNGLSKLAQNGKMAIIQNGSPLFSRDAGSGPSNIRQYILENDWLDAIIQLSTDQFMNTGISTYIWVLSKDKPEYRTGKVQLVDASHCCEPCRKNIGTKRNDISDLCRSLIVRAYGEYKDGAVYGNKNGVYCQSKVFGSEEFGYNKIVVERPLKDEQGEIVLKKGKPIANPAFRDTENVPLVQDIDRYFAREVLPYAPDIWIDKKKMKVGYEIPMTRYFHEYQSPKPVENIVERITALEADIAAGLKALFHEGRCDGTGDER